MGESVSHPEPQSFVKLFYLVPQGAEKSKSSYPFCSIGTANLKPWPRVSYSVLSPADGRPPPFRNDVEKMDSVQNVGKKDHFIQHLQYQCNLEIS